jgi:hypothetical protein
MGGLRRLPGVLPDVSHPTGYAAAVRKVGEMLFTMILESYAPWPGWPESSTRTELRAAVADLRHLEGFLVAVGREHAVSSLTGPGCAAVAVRGAPGGAGRPDRPSYRGGAGEAGGRYGGGVAMVWGSMSSNRASFTVEADRERAELWREAAERCMSVSSWLTEAADTHLRELARSGRARPLLWDRAPSWSG